MGINTIINTIFKCLGIDLASPYSIPASKIYESGEINMFQNLFKGKAEPITGNLEQRVGTVNLATNIDYGNLPPPFFDYGNLPPPLFNYGTL